LVALGVACGRAEAQQQDPAVEVLKRELQEMKRQREEDRRRLEELERRAEGGAGAAAPPSSRDPGKSALDAALDESEPAGSPGGTAAPGAPAAPVGNAGDLWSRQAGPVNFRLIDISLDALTAVGTSTEREPEILRLQAGGHDPKRRGFTLQNAELLVAGAVDPFFQAQANIVYFVDPEGETVVELEEAFFQTLSLPLGLQLEGGQSYVEFGRINPRHPHQWHWLDQPIINSRLFGPDGMRAPGFRLGWLTPLPFFSELHFGMANANGETLQSFLSSDELAEKEIGRIGGRQGLHDSEVRNLGDLVYLGRWVNGGDLTDEVNIQLGMSGLYGPNGSGPRGETFVYGADLVLKWQATDSMRGWPFVLWETEIMGRRFRADRYFDPGADIVDPADDLSLGRQSLDDWGLYSQVSWGFTWRWIVGLRWEYVRAQEDAVGIDREAGAVAVFDRESDPFRDERHRISPLITFMPTEFSRIRVQYNYDIADRLGGGDAHSIWLGVEIGFGKHPAHSY